jgi:hypothetical protein
MKHHPCCHPRTIKDIVIGASLWLDTRDDTRAHEAELLLVASAHLAATHHRGPHNAWGHRSAPPFRYLGHLIITTSLYLHSDRTNAIHRPSKFIGLGRKCAATEQFLKNATLTFRERTGHYEIRNV